MICTPLHSIFSVIIGCRLEHKWKVDINQLFFNFLSMSTQLWAALININSYQLNCEMLLSISMSTSIVPILAYQLFLINALNISVSQTLFKFLKMRGGLSSFIKAHFVRIRAARRWNLPYSVSLSNPMDQTHTLDHPSGLTSPLKSCF